MGVGRWQDGEPRVAGDEPARLDALARREIDGLLATIGVPEADSL